MEDVDAVAQPRWLASRWQRENASSLCTWRRSDRSLALPQLNTLCQAVNDTARYLSSDLRSLGDKLQPTRTCCDDLAFRDSNEAAAYAVQHLADRYGRVTQVLERLFVSGHLPLRRRRLSVLEIGAGPAPGLYALRDFYADLATWAQSVGQQIEFVPVSVAAALDRGTAWTQLIHILSENLIQIRARLDASSLGALPFRVDYGDISGFSAIQEHTRALNHAAAVIADEFDRSDEPITWGTARSLAEANGVNPPSAYDVMIMSNFLTTEDSVTTLRRELKQLASDLTSGGLLITLGHPHGKKYTRIWSELRSLMRTSKLTELAGFVDPISANPDPSWAKAIRRQRQVIFDEIRAVGALPANFADLQESDGFPPFQAHVWKNQQPPRGRG